MFDFVIYFGPLEFLACFTLPIAVLMGGGWLWYRTQQRQEWQRVVTSFPYPAWVFRGDKPLAWNQQATNWRGMQDLIKLSWDVQRRQQHIVRTLYDDNAEAVKVRGVNVTRMVTLLLMEDNSVTKRQQSYYRNFIRNVGHELKTPLTIIQGHASKVSSSPNDIDGNAASLSIIGGEAKHLTQLVDNLLLIARLEAPDFQLDRRAVNFGALVEQIILDVSDLAETRQIGLDLNLQPGLPQIQGDPVQLRQMLINLLDNALKYTPAGGTVAVSLSQIDTMLSCRIRDTGEGIPEDDLPFIFEKLFRAQRTSSRTVEGSGLGLALVQQIVQAHDGDLNVRSELGVGSTFTVELPVSQEAA